MAHPRWVPSIGAIAVTGPLRNLATTSSAEKRGGANWEPPSEATEKSARRPRHGTSSGTGKAVPTAIIVSMLPVWLFRTGSATIEQTTSPGSKRCAQVHSSVEGAINLSS